MTKNCLAKVNQDPTCFEQYPVQKAVILCVFTTKYEVKLAVHEKVLLTVR